MCVVTFVKLQVSDLRFDHGQGYSAPSQAPAAAGQLSCDIAGRVAPRLAYRQVSGPWRAPVNIVRLVPPRIEGSKEAGYIVWAPEDVPAAARRDPGLSCDGRDRPAGSRT